jgi:PTH2 family peptidyl-tRNA hydrolase
MFQTIILCLVFFIIGIYFKKLLYSLAKFAKSKKEEIENKATKLETIEEEDCYDTDYEDEDLKMVFLVREDLKMGTGKIGAQVAHAAVGLFSKISTKGKQHQKKILKAWDEFGSKKIVLKAKSIEELEEVHKKCKLKGIASILISDAGRTQVDPGTVTVCGIGPDVSEKIDKITGEFKLMK